jgi:hypothetical protein
MAQRAKLGKKSGKLSSKKPALHRHRAAKGNALTGTHVLLAIAVFVLGYGALHVYYEEGGGREAVVAADVGKLVDAGRTLIENMAFADALVVFKKAHALAPSNTVCGLYLGNMLVANRKYRDAAAQYDATLSCCAPRGDAEIGAARARGDANALRITADLLFGLGLSMRYADKHEFEDQRETLHAELELLGAGAGDKLMARIEKQVAEEEEEQRQKLEMERMERNFLEDE